MHPIHQSFHTSLFNPSSASILYLQVVSKQLCALFPGSVQCFDNAIRLFIVFINLKHYIEKKNQTIFCNTLCMENYRIFVMSSFESACTRCVEAKIIRNTSTTRSANSRYCEPELQVVLHSLLGQFI